MGVRGPAVPYFRRMLLLSPKNFSDYELIDCGDFEKLERFGKYITIRPEPQAVWDKILPQKEWEKKAHVKFVPRSSSSGDWKKLKEMPDRWNVQYQNLKFRLALTSFKHVGIFPEQAANWDYIAESIHEISSGKNFTPPSRVGGPRVLNLFAYTGGASLAAKAAGADITHLDSIKQVVSWARENMELSGLTDIRWVVEDALTFVKREVKRGKKYNGIILDPPAYGHGTDGQKWKLEEMINETMKMRRGSNRSGRPKSALTRVPTTKPASGRRSWTSSIATQIRSMPPGSVEVMHTTSAS